MEELPVVLARVPLFSSDQPSQAKQDIFRRHIAQQFNLGMALNNSDGLLDACAQELNNMFGKNYYAVETVRMLCHKYAKAKHDEWLKSPKAINNWMKQRFTNETDYVNFLVSLQYTAKERKAAAGQAHDVSVDHKLLEAIFDVEAMILCKVLDNAGVKIHTVQLVENPNRDDDAAPEFIPSHVLIDGNGRKVVGDGASIEWNDARTIHLAVENNRVVPISRPQPSVVVDLSSGDERLFDARRQARSARIWKAVERAPQPAAPQRRTVARREEDSVNREADVDADPSGYQAVSGQRVANRLSMNDGSSPLVDEGSPLLPRTDDGGCGKRIKDCFAAPAHVVSKVYHAVLGSAELKVYEAPEHDFPPTAHRIVDGMDKLVYFLDLMGSDKNYYLFHRAGFGKKYPKDILVLMNDTLPMLLEGAALTLNILRQPENRAFALAFLNCGNKLNITDEKFHVAIQNYEVALCDLQQAYDDFSEAMKGSDAQNKERNAGQEDVQRVTSQQIEALKHKLYAAKTKLQYHWKLGDRRSYYEFAPFTKETNDETGLHRTWSFAEPRIALHRQNKTVSLLKATVDSSLHVGRGRWQSAVRLVGVGLAGVAPAGVAAYTLSSVGYELSFLLASVPQTYAFVASVGVFGAIAGNAVSSHVSSNMMLKQHFITTVAEHKTIGLPPSEAQRAALRAMEEELASRPAVAVVLPKMPPRELPDGQEQAGVNAEADGLDVVLNDVDRFDPTEYRAQQLLEAGKAQTLLQAAAIVKLPENEGVKKLLAYAGDLAGDVSDMVCEPKIPRIKLDTSVPVYIGSDELSGDGRFDAIRGVNRHISKLNTVLFNGELARVSLSAEDNAAIEVINSAIENSEYIGIDEISGKVTSLTSRLSATLLAGIRQERVVNNNNNNNDASMFARSPSPSIGGLN